MVRLSNGEGTLGSGEIVAQDARATSVKITETRPYPRIKKRLHLAFCPPKNINRIHFLLEKSVELGVSRLSPLISAHSERKKLDHEKSRRILIAALKQSQNPFLPELQPIQTLQKFLPHLRGDSCGIAHCLPDSVPKKNPKDLFSTSNSDSVVMIGPEGDFSPAEVEKALQVGCKSISLGEQRLRTETASIYVCSVFHFLNQ